MTNNKTTENTLTLLQNIASAIALISLGALFVLTCPPMLSIWPRILGISFYRYILYVIIIALVGFSACFLERQ